ncbi:phage tail termination protein [Mycolicibacterium palauense]|uniref:phage tail termination protein n=1 Tax=Mycolicibacterium palauense TaxID=2034511 RepID=UPI000BFED07E|nr:hypothetical protein [Mycolicibacterium palauense]
MLELPDWFEGGYIDVEQLVVSYFEWLLGDRVFLCTWMKPGHYELSPGEEFGGTQPTLRVWRQPGKVDDQTRIDQCLVQIAAITPTRHESWKLTNFVRRMMDEKVLLSTPIHLPDGSKHRFVSSDEWTGPQVVPERYVDEKFIPVTFKLGIREPADLPNYAGILKTLSH